MPAVLQRLDTLFQELQAECNQLESQKGVLKDQVGSQPVSEDSKFVNFVGLLAIV